MAWTYNTSDLNSTSTGASLARVRFLAQDVSTGDQLIEDEAINWVLSDYPNVFDAAAVVARAIGAKFAQRASNESVLDASLAYTNRANHYDALAEKLEKKGKDPRSLSIAPYAGGISVNDKNTQMDDTDWSKPAFARGMHDHPGTGGTQPDWIENYST